MLAVVLARALSSTPRYELLTGSHITEVAEILEQIADGPPCDASHVLVGTTSMGVRISAGQIDAAGGPVHHFTLSRSGSGLTDSGAAVLANLIRQLRYPDGQAELTRRHDGVFQFLVRPPARPVEATASG